MSGSRQKRTCSDECIDRSIYTGTELVIGQTVFLKRIERWIFSSLDFRIQPEIFYHTPYNSSKNGTDCHYREQKSVWNLG